MKAPGSFPEGFECIGEDADGLAQCRLVHPIGRSPRRALGGNPSAFMGVGGNPSGGLSEFRGGKRMSSNRLGLRLPKQKGTLAQSRSTTALKKLPPVTILIREGEPIFLDGILYSFSTSSTKGQKCRHTQKSQRCAVCSYRNHKDGVEVVAHCGKRRGGWVWMWSLLFCNEVLQCGIQDIIWFLVSQTKEGTAASWHNRQRVGFLFKKTTLLVKKTCFLGGKLKKYLRVMG